MKSNIAIISLLLVFATASARLPNIVFILSDDQGLNAIGYNNPEVLTPHINDLASNGAILDQHYTYLYCSPTRSALLTGRWPFKAAGVRANIPQEEIDGENLGFTFLPQRLKEAGYATHHVGKWHLGFADFRYTPTARGFDTSEGFFTGDRYHFNQTNAFPGSCPNHRTIAEIFKNGVVQKQLQGTHDTLRFTTTAVNIIQDHASTFGTEDIPLFLYLPYNSPHSPIEVDDEYYNLYPNINYPLQRTLYGMISEVDAGVGKVVSALKSTGLWENTIIVYAGDNGSPVAPSVSAGWHSHSVAGSNYPYRGGKSSNWEGGVRTPAVISGGFLPPSQRGKTLFGPIHVVDWYATFITLAGLDPTDRNKLSPSPVDGINQWPWLSGQVSTSLRNVVILEHNLFKANAAGEAVGALIVNNYKLLIGPQPWSSWYGGPENNYFTPNQSVPFPPSVSACTWSQPCLFDISIDRYEHNDIASLPSSAPIISNIINTYWAPLYNDYHPPKSAPQDLVKYCAMLDKNNGFLAPYIQFNEEKTYYPPTAAPTRPTAQPTTAPSGPSIQPTVQPTKTLSVKPTAKPSYSNKICQFSGYCKASTDCVPGNKCVTISQFFSQCIPDPTTFLTAPGYLANWAGKCSSTSQCADPGAYCDLSISFPQCHQASQTSGLCTTPTGYAL